MFQQNKDAAQSDAAQDPKILLSLSTKIKNGNELGSLNPEVDVDLCKFIPNHRYLLTWKSISRPEIGENN